MLKEVKKKLGDMLCRGKEWSQMGGGGTKVKDFKHIISAIPQCISLKINQSMSRHVDIPCQISVLTTLQYFNNINYIKVLQWWDTV